jgi:hypothetical protein
MEILFAPCCFGLYVCGMVSITQIRPETIKFLFVTSYNFDSSHFSVSRDDTIGLQMEVITSKNSGGYGVGKETRYYL